MNVRESIRQATIGEVLGAAIWITLLSLPIVGVAWIIIGVLTGQPLVTYEVETVTATRPQYGGLLLDAYTGDTGNFGVATASGDVWDGSKSLEYAPGASDVPQELIISDGWGTTVVADKTYRARIQVANAMFGGVGFFLSGTGFGDADGYLIRLGAGGTEKFEIRRLDNGGSTVLATANQDIFDEMMYTEFSVDTATSPNTIRADLHREGGSQVNSVSAQDDTHTAGAHGWMGQSGVASTVHYDELEKISDSPQ